MSYEVTNNFLRHAALDGYATDLSVQLFKNDITPTDASVMADFTLEGNRIGLKGLTVGNPTVSGVTATQLYRYTDNVNGPLTIYGVIIYINDTFSTLLYAHRFASPINISSGNSANIVVDINRSFKQL